MDLGLGLGLIIDPGWTLGKIRILAPGGEGGAYLHWIGGMTAGVGTLYFMALLDGRSRRLRAAFLSTGVLRLWSGLLCAFGVVLGPLTWLYLLLALPNVMMAAFQFAMLRAGREDGE